jgi:hypothetical protein
MYRVQRARGSRGRGAFVMTKDFQWGVVHCDYAHWLDQHFQLTVILTETGERLMSILHLDSRSADQNAIHPGNHRLSGRILVACFSIIDRQGDAGCAFIFIRDGLAEICGKCSDAALARQVIANEGHALDD